MLDPWTLWALLTTLALLLAGAMLFVWLLTPEEPALAHWSAGFVLLASGICGSMLRDQLGYFVGVGLTNAAFVGSYGLMWTGLRLFDRRAPRTYYAALGPLVWLVICQFPPLRDSTADRVAVLSAMICVLIGLALSQLWRGRALASKARQTLMVLLAASFLLNIIRAPLASRQVVDDRVALFTDPQMAWFGFIGLAMGMFMCFMLVLMVRERSELHYKSAALIDPLTGVLNRRGFLERALAMSITGGPQAVMVLDLDNFKQVNDRFGHAAGDNILALFARCMRRTLKQQDIIGRTGGEEFVALLPNADAVVAREAALRIQQAFTTAASELAIGDGSVPLNATVSIGLAFSHFPPGRAAGEAEATLHELIGEADNALYRAKDGGRNRVEMLARSATQGAA